MKISTKYICLTALFTALVCLITRFIQIAIPLGYFNIGNCVILIFCYLLPFPYGIIIGSVGSALADLLSFPEYAIPTLIIKALMPLLYYILSRPFKGKYVMNIISAAISMLIPLAGYTITGMILYNSIATGLTQLPGLVLEYVANCILFAILLLAVSKAQIKKYIEQDY